MTQQSVALLLLNLRINGLFFSVIMGLGLL